MMKRIWFYMMCLVLLGACGKENEVENPLGVEMETIQVSATTARFEGKALETAPDFEVGVLYSLTDDVLVQTSELVTEYRLDENDRFSFVLTGLLPGTTYYYRVVTRINDHKTYGEVDSFQTEGMGKAVDLSSAGTANCYVISSAGTYKFKAVKGNSEETVGEVASAEVLWETFGTADLPAVGDLIPNRVDYVDGWVQFMTAEVFHEGNACIAVKDADGKILWSWHLWMTDAPQEQVYVKEAGVLMDRNLGATSAERTSEGTLGLLYQWGRKDPFVGAAGPQAKVVAGCTGQWEGPVKPDAETGTMAYTVAHPTTFIDFNWPKVDWLFDAEDPLAEERWSSEKTIYDPCPAGWRVPDGGAASVWAKAGIAVPGKGVATSVLDNKYDSDHHGWAFVKELMDGAEAWYPVTGFKYAHTGDIWDFPYNALYHTTLNEGMYSYNFELYLENRGQLVLESPSAKANANPVRCQKIL